MLEPREKINLNPNGTENNEKTTIQSVDEILEEYGIKDLTLEELQEKYVNDSDADYDKYLELEEKYDDLKNIYSSLEENIDELTATIEDLELTVKADKTIINNNGALVFIIIALIIAIVCIFKQKHS